MNNRLIAISLFTLLVISSSLSAEDDRTLIFEDNFDRNESQEVTDEIGNGWGTNSRARAGGNKQVDLKDGAMHITMHPAADHAVSVTHAVEFENGIVQLRFRLEETNDVLGLDFADLQYKEVHAGHLFKVDVANKYVQINDMKTGNMNLKYYDANKAKTLTDEQKKFLQTTRSKTPAKILTGQWHELLVEIKADRVRVSVDGEEAASFQSPGFAHPTKRMLRIAVPHSAVVDELKIYSLQ